MVSENKVISALLRLDKWNAKIFAVFEIICLPNRHELGLSRLASNSNFARDGGTSTLEVCEAKRQSIIGLWFSFYARLITHLITG